MKISFPVGCRLTDNEDISLLEWLMDLLAGQIIQIQIQSMDQPLIKARIERLFDSYC